jgi:hypothetical protein
VNELVEVVAEVTNEGEWKETGNLADTIAQLQAALDAIPEEYRATATIELKSYYESEDVRFKVLYTRPITDAEVRRREIAQAMERERRVAAEIETYERLKRKYG